MRTKAKNLDAKRPPIDAGLSTGARSSPEIVHLRTAADWQTSLAPRLASPGSVQTLLVVFEAPPPASLRHFAPWRRTKRVPGLSRYLPMASSLPSLAEQFDPLAYAARENCLPWKELQHALQAPNRGDLVVAGLVDEKLRTVTLWRGNLRPLVLPWSAFRSTGPGPKPDFGRFRVVDHGQTVCLGAFEAATDALLYEFDPDFRRRTQARLAATERGLGPSLRRLRKQRGLAQSDFAPLAARTVARIELGQVTRVQAGTLKRLADKLGVAPEELDSF